MRSDELSFATEVKRDEGVHIAFDTFNVWTNVHKLVNVAAVVKKITTLVDPFPKARAWLDRMRNVIRPADQPSTAEEPKETRVWVNPDYVHKYYKSATVNARLKDYYSETHDITGLEHTVQTHQHQHRTTAEENKEREYRVFVLAPVGIPADLWDFRDEDMVEMGAQIATTLRELHKKKWVHLDIRASNIVLWDPRSHRRRWILVDSEWAVRIGQPVPQKRYTDEYCGQPALPKYDFLQLRSMLEKMRKGAKAEEQLSRLFRDLELA